MNTTPKGARLGKGLAALMGEAAAGIPAATSQVRMAAIDLLEPNPFQPRLSMSESNLEELADSIRAQGILQPILVRPHPSEPDRFEIVAGERRWRAAGLAGLHEVPVYERVMTDAEAAAAALVENLQREDLNPIDEAEGLQRLVKEFGFTHETMGNAVGKSRAHISNMLRLLQLPPPVQASVREGELSYGHARALISHPDPVNAAQKVIARGLSVRQTESLLTREASHKPRRQRRAQTPELEGIEKQIADALGLGVKIMASDAGGGQISIQFTNWDQLEDVRRRLVPQTD